MSKKDLILSDQGKLNELQIAKAEELQEHITKAQSLIDVICNSIESKNSDNKLDLASELNSMVAVFDNLECAAGDIDELINALKGIEATDEEHD